MNRIKIGGEPMKVDFVVRPDSTAPASLVLARGVVNLSAPATRRTSR